MSSSSKHSDMVVQQC